MVLVNWTDLIQYWYKYRDVVNTVMNTQLLLNAAISRQLIQKYVT